MTRSTLFCSDKALSKGWKNRQQKQDVHKKRLLRNHHKLVMEAPIFDKCDWYDSVLISCMNTTMHFLFMPIIISTLVSLIFSPIWVCRQCVWDLAYSIGSYVFSNGSDPKSEV
jgi:hypothetical protein